MAGKNDRLVFRNDKTGEEQVYVLQVFKVRMEKPDGTPSLLDHIHDEAETHIDGGERFITAYVREDVFYPERSK